MAYNGSGTFTLVAGNPVVTGTTISSTWANNTLSDIATNGLTNAITKDGQTSITANIPFNSMRITGLGAAIAVTDAPQLQQVQGGGLNSISAVTGASTIAGSVTPTPASLREGMSISFTAVGANAANPTFNLNSLGALPIFWAGATCTSSMWKNGTRIDLVYLSTSQSTASATGWHVMGHSAFIPAPALRIKGTLATSNGTGDPEFISPSADGQIPTSTASTSAGIAFVSFASAAGAQSANRVFAGPASGAAATPTFRALVAADGAAVTLISAATASNSTSLDFTGLTSAYARYIFVCELIRPATDEANLVGRISIDNGSNYLNDGAYQYALARVESGGITVNPITSSTATEFTVSSGGIDNAATSVLQGTVELFSPSNTTAHKGIEVRAFYFSGTFNYCSLVGHGRYTNTTSAVNAFRFLMSSGNITSGVIYLYGVSKS